MSVSFLVNVFLSAIKIIFGFIGHSSALIADGFHSFSDLITDVVAIFGNRLAIKLADEDHPYGHGKLEYLTSIIIGAVIMIIGVGIIINSFKKDIVIPDLSIVVISLMTIVVKYVLAFYLTYQGKKYRNNILLASGKESKMDVLSSIVVLLSLVFIQGSNTYSILKYSDIIATVIVGLFIIKTGFEIFRDNSSIIIGKQENNKTIVEPIKDILLSNISVLSVDDFIMLKYGQCYELRCEVYMDGNISLLNSHTIIDDIEKKIKKLNHQIKYITIHINPYIKKGNN